MEHQKRVAEFISDALWCKGNIKCADVILAFPCGQFPAHKLVIGAHSRIFCETYLREPELTFYDLRTPQYNYVTKDGFNRIMRYMYTGIFEPSEGEDKEIQKLVHDFSILGILFQQKVCFETKELNQITPDKFITSNKRSTNNDGQICPNKLLNQDANIKANIVSPNIYNKFSPPVRDIPIQMKTLLPNKLPRFQNCVCMVGNNPPLNPLKFPKLLPGSMITMMKPDMGAMKEENNIICKTCRMPFASKSISPIKIPTQFSPPIMSSQGFSISPLSKITPIPRASFNLMTSNFQTTQNFMSPIITNYPLPLNPQMFQIMNPPIFPLAPFSTQDFALQRSPSIGGYSSQISRPIPMASKEAINPVIMKYNQTDVGKTNKGPIIKTTNEIEDEKHDDTSSSKLGFVLMDRRNYQNMTTNQFLALNLQEILLVLKDDYLAVENEVEVFSSAWKWIYHNKPSRWSKIREVMKCVRFPLMTVRQLLMVAREIERLAEVEDFLLKACWYHTCLQMDAMNNMIFPIAKPRICYGLKEIDPFSIYNYPMHDRLVPLLSQWKNIIPKTSFGKDDEDGITKIIMNLGNVQGTKKEVILDKIANMYEDILKSRRGDIHEKDSLTLSEALERLKQSINQLHEVSGNIDRSARSSIGKLRKPKKFSSTGQGVKIIESLPGDYNMNSGSQELMLPIAEEEYSAKVDRHLTSLKNKKKRKPSKSKNKNKK
ncbi:unnamed protein product [Gordionus sp. m RMFG-2023]|uniref:uncharacterized protein LOC135929742 n=1 Tax=Gordionus sp. m RMFG-2023 TaxID=3053472 RepID=UPI0030DEC99D